MKKVLFLLGLVLLWTSCHKEPSLSDLDNDFIVETDYDSSAQFNSFTTYFIADSVLIIGGDKEPRYWVNNESSEIINTFIKNMNTRGYTRTMNKEEADLGMQVSYISTDTYGYDYMDDPYWWWDYPGYWGPGYWGPGWGGWYYPYPVIYRYRTGSLLAELVDLKARVPRDTNSNLTVVWSAYMTGLLSSSNQINMQLTVRAIDQAFSQTPQIQK